jgi:4-amino-4-deoxy-L-arabinose transferase-like glycosyltransferase
MEGHNPDSSKAFWRRPLWWIAAIAILVRVPLALYNEGILWPDSLSYLKFAMNIAANGSFALHKVYETPLYPMFLSLFLKLLPKAPLTGWLIILAQHLLGIASTFLLWRGGRRLFNESAAVIGALLFTVNPVVLYYEHVVHTETLFIFLLCCLFYRVLRMADSPTSRDAIELALWCVALTLTRPVAKILVLTVLLWLLLKVRKPGPALARGLVLVLTYSVLLLPWMTSNYANFGFFGISKGEGKNLLIRTRYIGLVENRTKDGRQEEAASPETGKKPRRRVTSKVERDDSLLDYNLRMIRQNPWLFARDSLRDFFLIVIAPQNSIHFDRSAPTPVLDSPHLGSFTTVIFPNRPRRPSSSVNRLVYFQLTRLKPKGVVVFSFFMLGLLFFLVDRTRDRATGLLALSHVAYFALAAAVFIKPIDRFFLPACGFYFLFAAWGAVSLFRLAVSRRRSAGA